jgi:hypothetical protein
MLRVYFRSNLDATRHTPILGWVKIQCYFLGNKASLDFQEIPPGNKAFQPVDIQRILPGNKVSAGIQRILLDSKVS